MGCNDWQVAIMGGRHMAEIIEYQWGGWEAVDKVVLLQNPVGGEMTMLRSEGFATALSQTFGDEVEQKIVRVDGGMGGAEQAKIAMDQVLIQYPDAKKIAVTPAMELAEMYLVRK